RGAGAEMRQTLGTAVFSGMLGVTLFGLLLTPVFFYSVDWLGDAHLFRSLVMQRFNHLSLALVSLGPVRKSFAETWARFAARLPPHLRIARTNGNGLHGHGENMHGENGHASLEADAPRNGSDGHHASREVAAHDDDASDVERLVG